MWIKYFTNDIITLLHCKLRKQSPKGTVWNSMLWISIQWRVVVGNQKLNFASASNSPALRCICGASVSGIVDQNGIPLINFVVE